MILAGFSIPNTARLTILPSHPDMIRAIANLEIGVEGPPTAVNAQMPFKYRTRRIPGSRGPARYGTIHDYLYVGEGLYRLDGIARYASDASPVRASDGNGPAAWAWQREQLPSMYMPQWAARYLLIITGVRLVHVQEMTRAEALSEGVPSVAAYAALWDRLNADRGYPWADNPQALDITFRRLT